jgi:hypothetical protein
MKLNRVFFETKKVSGILKMDKNKCPKNFFRGKKLAKKSTIFDLQRNRAKCKKNNFSATA